MKKTVVFIEMTVDSQQTAVRILQAIQTMVDGAKGHSATSASASLSQDLSEKVTITEAGYRKS